MRTLWVLTLWLVALIAVQGCKQKEPIPGPKAGLVLDYVHGHTPGIAWFQGSLDEAFARADHRRNCREHALMAAPRTTDLARTHKHPNSPPPLPSPAACTMDPCPPITRPRHRLV